MASHPIPPTRGRGALGNPDNRFAEHGREAFDGGWRPMTHVTSVTDSPVRTGTTPDSACVRFRPYWGTMRS